MSIEAALLAPEGRVYAIEVDPEGVEICRENAARARRRQRRGDRRRARPRRWPASKTPDAVFVGGSKGSMQEIIEVALERLAPGGRLVVNAITLENVAEAYQALPRARAWCPR